MAIIRGLAFWLIVIPLVHGVVPWAISTLTPRYGWTAGFPGGWNWIGLIPVIAAITLLIWVYGWHPPERLAVMVRGPYRFTRNPIYIAYLGLWLGWALFFGSISVFIAWLLLCLAANLVIVPQEERELGAGFGEVYSQYKNRVPRWFGRK